MAVSRPMEKFLISMIFMKSIILYWKNLKLGMVITWTISKIFHCHSSMPGGILFLGPYFAKGLQCYWAKE